MAQLVSFDTTLPINNIQKLGKESGFRELYTRDHGMSKDHTPPVWKSTPVSSPLQKSVQSLRVPHRVAHQPETMNSASPSPLMPTNSSASLGHQRKISRVPSDDGGKQRLVDQFYEHGTPLSSTTLATPARPQLPSRPSVQDSIRRGEDSMNFLKQTAQKDGEVDYEKCVLLADVRKVEKRLVRTVKDQFDTKCSVMDEEKSEFHALEQELSEIKTKVENYVLVVLENKDRAGKDFEVFAKEIEKLNGTLSVLNQYENALLDSRTKLAENKAKLKGLWKLVDEDEKLQAQITESIRSRNKALLWCFAIVLVAVALYKAAR